MILRLAVLVEHRLVTDTQTHTRDYGIYRANMALLGNKTFQLPGLHPRLKFSFTPNPLFKSSPLKGEASPLGASPRLPNLLPPCQNSGCRSRIGCWYTAVYLIIIIYVSCDTWVSLSNQHCAPCLLRLSRPNDAIFTSAKRSKEIMSSFECVCVCVCLSICRQCCSKTCRWIFVKMLIMVGRVDDVPFFPTGPVGDKERVRPDRMVEVSALSFLRCFDNVRCWLGNRNGCDPLKRLPLIPQRFS